MKKFKKFFALLGIILLAGLYLSTIVFACIGSDYSFTLLKVSIYLTITVPIVLYAMMMIYRLLANHNHEIKTNIKEKSDKK